MDVAPTTDFEVHADASPAGSFTQVVASAPSGSPGPTIAIPPDPLVFYLVGAINGCARGPLGR